MEILIKIMLIMFIVSNFWIKYAFKPSPDYSDYRVG